MRNSLPFLALLIAVPAAQAQEDRTWTRITTTDSGTVIKARTADLHAGRSTMTAAKVWVEMDASRDRTVNWRTAKILYAVNCTNETYRVVTTTFYAPDGTTRTHSDPYPELRHIIPDTNMESVASILCYDPDTNNFE